MPRLTRKESQQLTRERLLASARKEIASKGIIHASIRDIAEAAGYSLGAFYSNFKSKEAVLEMLVELHMNDEIRIFREIVEKTVNGEKLLDRIADWLKKLQEKSNLAALEFEFRMHAQRSGKFRKKFTNASERRFQELAAGLRDLFVRYGLKPRIDFFQMAIGFVSLWNGFFFHETVPGAKPDETVLAFLKALLESSTAMKTDSK